MREVTTFYLTGYSKVGNYVDIVREEGSEYNFLYSMTVTLR